MSQNRENGIEKQQERPKLERAKLIKSLQIFKYVKPYRIYFFIGLFLLSASSLIFMIFPGAAGEMANTANGKAKYMLSVKDYGWLFLIILVVQGVLSFFRTYFYQNINNLLLILNRKTAIYRVILRVLYALFLFLLYLLYK